MREREKDEEIIDDKIRKNVCIVYNILLLISRIVYIFIKIIIKLVNFSCNKNRFNELSYYPYITNILQLSVIIIIYYLSFNLYFLIFVTEGH